MVDSAEGEAGRAGEPCHLSELLSAFGTENHWGALHMVKDKGRV